MALCPLLLFEEYIAVLYTAIRKHGLPIGVQIVGKRWDESRLLAMVQALSTVTDTFQRLPDY
jgi:Asp-tRNA(Asn)/Glu-tRNA(Gln) amidotransferase A subunit family amidase